MPDRIPWSHPLTSAEYAAIYAYQDGACAICGRRPKFKLVQDHQHGTRNVRGLLCAACNTGMGKLGDTPEGLLRAVKYLIERDSPSGERYFGSRIAAPVEVKVPTRDEAVAAAYERWLNEASTDLDGGVEVAPKVTQDVTMATPSSPEPPTTPTPSSEGYEPTTTTSSSSSYYPAREARCNGQVGLQRWPCHLPFGHRGGCL